MQDRALPLLFNSPGSAGPGSSSVWLGGVFLGHSPITHGGRGTGSQRPGSTPGVFAAPRAPSGPYWPSESCCPAAPGLGGKCGGGVGGECYAQATLLRQLARGLHQLGFAVGPRSRNGFGSATGTEAEGPISLKWPVSAKPRFLTDWPRAELLEYLCLFLVFFYSPQRSALSGRRGLGGRMTHQSAQGAPFACGLCGAGDVTCMTLQASRPK